MRLSFNMSNNVLYLQQAVSRGKLPSRMTAPDSGSLEETPFDRWQS
jgi:hypothetical protein